MKYSVISKINELDYPDNLIKDVFGDYDSSPNNELSELVSVAIKNGLNDTQMNNLNDLMKNIFNDRERSVIRLRYENFKTYEAIGIEQGITRQHAEFIIRSSKNRLKSIKNARKIFVYERNSETEKKETLLNETIDSLDLDRRTYNCLLPVTPYINDVIKKLKREGWRGFSKINGIGTRCLINISDSLLKNELINDSESYTSRKENCMKKIENGILEFDADCFVIPNHAGMLREYMLLSENDKQRIRNIAKLNNISNFTDDDRAIQLWFCSTDLKSDNLTDHGAYVEGPNGKMFFRPSLGLLPARIFENAKEGDVIDIKIEHVQADSAPGTFIDEDKRMTFNLLIHAHLKQLAYRYKMFGTFEDAFKYSIS